MKRNESRREHTIKQFVQLLGSCGDLDDLLAVLVHFCGCGEAHGHELGRRLDELVRLRLTDTFDRIA